MSGTIYTGYIPFDPLNVCSMCGDPARRSEMRKLPGGLYACNRPGCVSERSAQQLDRANARQKPFRILPVKDARPEVWNLPDGYAADEGAVFNFLTRAVANGCRFESVASGTETAIPGSKLPAFGWIARYLYGLIVENQRPRQMLSQARTMLTTIAAGLQSQQIGFGLSTSSTRATDAAYGAFLETGSAVYVTQDAASCGLAMLYAYRLTGTASYLLSARAAASYLRNVQAIGSSGTNFTSSDSLGSARLYTGAVASQVSTASGFYSTHAFYPSDLLTLEFWKALKDTDGDQSIGATSAVTGFATTPSQLLSTSITDMRAFWENGTLDSAGAMFTGLSATTPREFFNAYPTGKINFNTIIGSGRWEFADGDANSGTQITAQNFAMALEALYSYEGQSSQVTDVSDWLRSFAANPTFEIGDAAVVPNGTESQAAFARSVLGAFDPTLSPTTLLTVRDSTAAYATTKKNGTGLYDWGAFGMLSSLLGARNGASFTQARLSPLGRNQRFEDGQRSDGDHFDRITLRGMSGLGFQTAFASDVNGSNSYTTTLPVTGGGAVTGPPTIGLVQWTKGDVGLTQAIAGRASAWADQSGHGQNWRQGGANPGNAPFVNGDTLDGIPLVSFGESATGNKYFDTAASFFDRNGTAMDGSSARTVAVVVKPKYDIAVNRMGGPLWSATSWVSYFFFDPLAIVGPANGAYAWSDILGDYGDACNFSPQNGVQNGPYDGVSRLVIYTSTGRPQLNFYIDESAITLSPTTMHGAAGAASQARLSDDAFSFRGGVAEVLVWDYALTATDRSNLMSYLATRYPSLGFPSTNLLTVNDAVRAAQFGQSFRINPNSPVQS